MTEIEALRREVAELREEVARLRAAAPALLPYFPPTLLPVMPYPQPSYPPLYHYDPIFPVIGSAGDVPWNDGCGTRAC